MDPIVAYLKIDEFLENKTEPRIQRMKVARYVIYYDKLYRRGYLMPLLKCLTPSKVDYIMRKIHEGICGESYWGQSLAFKMLR